jgi:hypothetical protein
MHDLVNFLVEERYCNTESEAIKIIESVSDEFYDSLVEAYKGKYDIGKRSPERLSMMRSKLKSLTNKAQQDPGSITPEMADKINRIRVSIPDQESLSRSEMEKRKKEGTSSKGLQPTPKGPGGTRAQKPPTVISGRTTTGTYANVARTDTRKLTKAATDITRISPESRGRTSVRTGPESGEIVKDLHTNPGASGARGTNVARSGGTRGVRTR